MRLKHYINRSLYHVTDFKSALNIMKHDYFRTSKNAETDKQGLSTTTDPLYFWNRKEARFILNTKKIKSKFKIRSIQPLKGIPNESEILILHDGPIKPAHMYIDVIEFYNTPDKIKEKIQKFSEQYNIIYK